MEIDISSEDVNKSFTLLETKINSLIEKTYAPEKTNKKGNKTWITREIRKATIKRNKIYKNKSKGCYQEIRNKIVGLCKKTYYQTFLQNIQIMQKKTGKG